VRGFLKSLVQSRSEHCCLECPRAYLRLFAAASTMGRQIGDPPTREVLLYLIYSEYYYFL
jgi:hypothetical protein